LSEIGRMACARHARLRKCIGQKKGRVSESHSGGGRGPEKGRRSARIATRVLGTDPRDAKPWASGGAEGAVLVRRSRTIRDARGAGGRSREKAALTLRLSSRRFGIDAAPPAFCEGGSAAHRWDNPCGLVISREISRGPRSKPAAPRRSPAAPDSWTRYGAFCRGSAASRGTRPMRRADESRNAIPGAHLPTFPKNPR